MIDAGMMNLKRAPFDLGRCLEDALDAVAPQAAAKGLELAYSVEDGTPTDLVGDATRLRQIALHFLSNAVKFTSTGEVVARAHGHVTADGQVALTIEVRDTGIGISKEQLRHLLYLFHQADPSTTHRSGGTEPGLSICARLAVAMGGRVEIDSEVGSGSIFRLEITLGQAKPEPVKPSSLFDAVAELLDVDRLIADHDDAADLSISGLRILLADDSSTSQQFALWLLQRLGCRADVVSDGLEAVDACVAAAYDVILMDDQMPNLDGVDATVRIRDALPRRRQPWIIALTGAVQSEDRQRYREAGMNDVLAKPVGLEALAEALARAKRAITRSHDSLGALRSSGTDATDIVDRGVLDDLAGVGAESDPHFLATLVQTYRRDADELINQIQAAAERGDTAARSRCAHTLRGASATIGALALPAICTQLEQAKSASPAEISRLVYETRTAHEQLIDALNDYLTG
jgi:CheY-like chemotaxis protein/HPt (histidine-containing phosphotransfer) domain-containing protein